MKDTLERMNSILSDTKECISDMEDRIMEITQSGQQNKKPLKNESNIRHQLSTEELMLLNCDVGEDSCESLGLQGDPTSPF